MRKFLITGLAFTLAVLILARFPSRNGDDESEPATAETTPADRRELHRMAADTDWSAFDEAELNGLVAQLEEARTETDGRNEFSVIVADGETLITDGYETGPGTFAFTSFTPEVVPGESGDLIQLSARRIEVNDSGDESELLLPAATFRPGVTISFTTTDFGEETERWSINITADIVPGGISVKGSPRY